MRQWSLVVCFCSCLAWAWLVWHRACSAGWEASRPMAWRLLVRKMEKIERPGGSRPGWALCCGREESCRPHGVGKVDWLCPFGIYYPVTGMAHRAPGERGSGEWGRKGREQARGRTFWRVSPLCFSRGISLLLLRLMQPPQFPGLHVTGVVMGGDTRPPTLL